MVLKIGKLDFGLLCSILKHWLQWFSDASLGPEQMFPFVWEEFSSDLGHSFCSVL